MSGTNRVLRVVTGSLFSAAMLAAVTVFGAGSAAAAAPADPGAVYVESNTPTNNQVLIFNRAANGTLSAAGAVATNGSGASGLGSQGALILTDNNRWLFGVNAGSNEISSFSVQSNGLTFASKVASGGIKPISLTVHKNLLYVLNAGDATNPGNITGFWVDKSGNLSPIPGSTQPLSSNAAGSTIGAAEVSFDPHGDVLVVTEKATNKIDLYVVDDAAAQAPTPYASVGGTPFGFAFDRRGDLIVSEASTGSVSSYDVSDDSLQVNSASVATHNAAPCWVIATRDAKFAYTTNAHNGVISGFAVSRDGKLTLLNANGVTATPGGTPLDMGLSQNGQYLYNFNAGTATINGFTVNANGSLAALNITGVSLPATAVGLAAR